MKRTIKNLWLAAKHHQFGLYLTLVLATLLSIQLFARTTFKYDSFTFNLQTVVGKPGGTTIAVPPVGRLFFKTHQTPWQFIITLAEIDFQKLEAQINSLPPKDRWLEIFQHELSKTVYTLFALIIFYGLLGALITLFIFRIKPKSSHFRNGLFVSLMVIFVLLGSTISTYDKQAIHRPQYQGVLASAPWIMNLISMGLDNIEAIGTNLKKVSQELPLLYKQAGAIKNLSELQTDLAVLHVSDIHNNPAAFDFIQELVVNFKIDLIIDTGDLTDYGTPLESKITGQFSRFKVPYLFVPGNHDTPFLLKQLRLLPNVKILAKGNINIKGLLIAGVADPASFNESSAIESPIQMENFKTALTESIGRLNQTPDIIAVHNSLLAADMIGKTPLILHGHDHQYRITHEKNTIIDDAGTTGSAGIRGLTEDGIPYSATVIYWKKDDSGNLRVRAADSIRIDGVKGTLTVTRHTF